MKTDLFEIRKLIHRYNDQPALQIDSLMIRRASIVGLIGPNGSGKSTLLKLLTCVYKPSEGEIFFNGKPIVPFGDAFRFRVTLLPQEPYLMKRSVFDNVAYGLRIRKDTVNLRKRVFNGLDMVGLLPEAFKNRQWNALSGGEAQRVALAARLVLKPEALLLDEPTASVDASSAQLIKEASINAREEWGTSLIIASHDLQWLYGICDETLHFFQGSLLDTKSVNLVFGPWEQFEDKSWGKTLSDGQRIILSSPKSRHSIALIKPFLKSVSVPGDMTSANETSLCGIAVRMILEQRSQETMVTVQVGNYLFTLRLKKEQLRGLNIYPGSSVVVGYNPDEVEWY